MADAPRNAGQSIVVENVVKGPVTTVDFGSITVTENWGRLFFAQRSKEPLVVLQSAYPALIAAIQHFTEPATPPAAVVEAMERALQNIRELNLTAEDENGHKWANSELIDQEITFSLADLEAWRAGK